MVQIDEYDPSAFRDSQKHSVMTALKRVIQDCQSEFDRPLKLKLSEGWAPSSELGSSRERHVWEIYEIRERILWLGPRKSRLIFQFFYDFGIGQEAVREVTVKDPRLLIAARTHLGFLAESLKWKCIRICKDYKG